MSRRAFKCVRCMVPVLLLSAFVLWLIVGTPTSWRSTTSPAANAIDASGIPAFWKCVEVLRRDKPLTDAQWDALFAEPGYAEWVGRNENSRERWQHLLEEAFRPSLVGTSIGSTEAVGRSDAQTRSHLRFAQQNRGVIDAFVKNWTKSEPMGLVADAVRPYLPPGCVDQACIPPVKLIVLYPGGYAFPDVIVMDACMLSFAGDPNSWMAHEMHHVFRYRLDCLDESSIDPDVFPIVKSLVRMEMDGIADLIDKRNMILRPEGLPPKEMSNPVLRSILLRYRDLLEQAPDFVRTINATLAGLAADPGAGAEFSDEFQQQLPVMSRQVIGMFMAGTIEQQLGRDRLATSVGNPFAFFRTYAEAALIASDPRSTPMIDQSVLELISDWERRFTKPREPLLNGPPLKDS